MTYEGSLAPIVSGARRVFCCHKAVLSGALVPNSIDAVAECVSANVPRLEIDVQFLADDAMLVYHDNDLVRESNGTGPVIALDRQSASVLRYRRDENVRIAFLEEIVDLVRESDCVLQVDLKLSQPFTRSRLDTFLDALKPLGERALVGSQAYWNVRKVAGQGPAVAIDPTWQWNMFGPLEDGIGPARQGIFGVWDDSPMAHLRGLAPREYVRGRIDDIAGLLPEATEWMVDWQTILHISQLGESLGTLLAEKNIGLTAWTVRDRGPEVTGPLLKMLFALGATTIITDNAARLATYAT